MEESKNKNGPLNVIELKNFTESEYRALNALSYSRLSDIEKVGIHAVNAKANDIGKLRGVSIGSIVDEVISERLTGIPSKVIKVKKMPTVGSSTYNIAHLVVDEFSFNNFDSQVFESSLIALCHKENMFTNGVTADNVYSKMQNYAEYINKIKQLQVEGDSYSIIVTEYDYLIIKKAIERLRKLAIFQPGYRTIKHASISSHIQYQLKLLATINGIEFKCMLDAVLFDHAKKKIIPIDIKTGVLSNNSFEEFFEDCYCFYNYYIQSGMYRKILIEFFKYHTEYSDYEVEDFRFIYSSTNPRNALKIEDAFTFQITQEKYLDSFKGFKIPAWNPSKKNPNEYKKGIATLFNFYKDNVINPSTREDLMVKFNEIQDAELPF